MRSPAASADSDAPKSSTAETAWTGVQPLRDLAGGAPLPGHIDAPRKVAHGRAVHDLGDFALGCELLRDVRPDVRLAKLRTVRVLHIAHVDVDHPTADLVPDAPTASIVADQFQGKLIVAVIVDVLAIHGVNGEVLAAFPEVGLELHEQVDQSGAHEGDVLVEIGDHQHSAGPVQAGRRQGVLAGHALQALQGPGDVAELILELGPLHFRQEVSDWKRLIAVRTKFIGRRIDRITRNRIMAPRSSAHATTPMLLSR